MYAEKDVSITAAASYANALRDLRKSKRNLCGKITVGVLLLHDKAPVHTGPVASCYGGFEEINHLPYNRNLASSDHFLFPNLKTPCGKHYSHYEELKTANTTHFFDKEEKYFWKVIFKS